MEDDSEFQESVIECLDGLVDTVHNIEGEMTNVGQNLEFINSTLSEKLDLLTSSLDSVSGNLSEMTSILKAIMREKK